MSLILYLKSYGRLIFWLWLLWQLPLWSQENPIQRLFLDIPADTFYLQANTQVDSLRLPHQFIISGSEKIYLGKFKLLRGIHYRLDEKDGKVWFLQPVQAGDSLHIIYQKYPFPLTRDYYHRKLQKLDISDSTVSPTTETTRMVSSRIMDEIDSYGSNLEKSGSIVRGVEIGTNRDLTLNSGLNLQLSGYVTPQVQIVAALTDESTPIQPEGNTQTLREVDKVFIKIISPHIGGTLGDFNLAYQNSNFGNLNRKLQGLTAYGNINQYSQQLTYASSRGTFHTNQFLGQEGNQGPYQLVGKNGEREIIVLAGTERVYVNGQLINRGENNQYIIDYSLGQITFTNNLLITGEDRVEVDFEYSNNFQRYGKNFIGFSSEKKSLRNGLSYDIRLFREWDDTNNLLEDSSPLTDQEKEALASAGDNPLQATVSGVDSVGAGLGVYVKRDTLLNNQAYRYFLYRGKGEGDFNIQFSNVGRGKGSYIRERLGVYRFVGPGNGEYLPVRLIPLAGDKKMANASLSYRLGSHFLISGEGALTSFDQNIFSEINDQDNFGKAFHVASNYLNDSSHLFGRRIGLVNWQVKWKYQEKEFAPLDRQFQPAFNYRWNLQSIELASDENTLETSLFYFPGPSLQFKVEGGVIERGNHVSSHRARGEAALLDSLRLKSDGYFEWVSSQNVNQKSDWWRGGAGVGKQIGGVFPYLQFRQEDRKVENNPAIVTGFSYQSGEAGMKLRKLLRIKWHIFSQVRDDRLYNPRVREQKLKLSRSFTHSLQGDIVQMNHWQGRLSFIFRSKDFEDFFKKMPSDSISIYQPDPQFQDTSWANKRSHLGRLELQYINESRTIDSRWQYRAGSELQALQEKVFFRLGENRGNYRWDEQLQEYVPDPQGDYLLVIIPSGKFESITNVEASWQIRYRPKADKLQYKGFDKIWRNISFFSSLKVDEKSREPDIWQLYLLNLEKFRNTTYTVRGIYVIDQDIYFFERNPNFGITLRSRYRDNLSNEFLDSGFNETRRSWDRSISWRQSLVARKLSQELEYQNNLLSRQVAAVPSRNRDILSHLIAATLNYRPVYAWQIQGRLEGAHQQDRAPENLVKVAFIEFRPQVNYAVASRSRIQLSFNVLKVWILENPFNRPLPFEMGKGKKEGISWSGNFRFEYFISNNVTTTFNLSGRRDAGAWRSIFIGQAEVRAFF